MLTRAIVLSATCSAFAFGCAGEPGDVDERQEIIDNLVQAGYTAEDIRVEDGVVFVQNDAAVSLEASREMIATVSGEEQYRTTNLMSLGIATVCVNGGAFTGAFSTALNNAIANYNALPLTFNITRTVNGGPGCQAVINGVIQPGLVGGSAGFPAGGLPFGQIIIGGGLSAFSVDVIEHVITHELGHCFGMRHSDWFNRSISCGSGGSEGAAPIGAILIPGTPAGAVVGGSIMNACFRTVETGEFTGTDVTAWNAVY